MRQCKTARFETASAAILAAPLALIPGTVLGAYEIVAPLGAGGMGEVYRATDSNLKRSVAIKVLPASVAGDVDRLARFQREAEVLAALNHPNIGAIYGLEKTADFTALVMELVEGEDLSQHIARGPIPLDEALPIAKQIAEALEAAHEQGIIHRDLKPANIKVRPDGTVKVLDFGLAKAMEPAGGSSTNAMNSPTLSMHATQAGIILGTAAYMSPEQARGKAVDRRADIWAFGLVVYEMLAGRRAFEGDDISITLANVLKEDVRWQALPGDVPTPVRRLLRRCLDKDPKRRLSAMGDARLELEEAVAPASEADVREPVPQANAPAWRDASVWAAVTLATGLALVLVLWVPWRRPAPPRITRMTIAASGPAALNVDGFDGDVAVSADGRHVVYVGNRGAELFARALDSLEPVAIAGGGVRGPFLSPDGQWVGFAIDANNSLRKVAITGGPPITIASLDGAPRGATWTPDDTIIFATTNPATGLQRISAAGGTAEVLTRPDHSQGESDHLWPEVLPGGRAVLFTIASQVGGLDLSQVVVRDLRTGSQKVLVRGGSDAHYVASGHLVYVAAGTLRAIPFDLSRLETHGNPMPVLPRLVTTPFGAGDFAVAADGTLVYVDASGSLAASERTLVWVDRAGKEESIAAPPRAYEHPRLSPDGTRIALSIKDQENDLWMWDLRRPTLTRLTLDPGRDYFPRWTPDGRRIVFSSNRGGNLNLWWQAADGTGAAERLTTSSNDQVPTGITPDGRTILFSEQTPTMGHDLMQVSLDGARAVTPLLQTTFDEHNGVVSADGRWLAYESNSSGTFAIYVRPFPNVNGGQWEVSTSGGTTPLWGHGGKSLFYKDASDAVVEVPVETNGVTWHAGSPTKLVEGRYFTGANSGSGGGPSYDVSPDGQRFLMIKAPEAGRRAAPPALIVVQHWDEELKRLVPTGR